MMDADNHPRPQSLLMGAILGALAGMWVSYVLSKRAEEQGRPVITAREGLSLGMMVLGLLRQVGHLGDGED